TGLIDHRIRKEDFAFQVFQVGIIEIKASLEGAIRHASLAFQEGNDLVEDIVECHAFFPLPAAFLTLLRRRRPSRSYHTPSCGACPGPAGAMRRMLAFPHGACVGASPITRG